MPFNFSPHPALKLAILKAKVLQHQTVYRVHVGWEMAAPQCGIFAAAKDAAILVSSLVPLHGDECRVVLAQLRIHHKQWPRPYVFRIRIEWRIPPFIEVARPFCFFSIAIILFPAPAQCRYGSTSKLPYFQQPTNPCRQTVRKLGFCRCCLEEESKRRPA